MMLVSLKELHGEIRKKFQSPTHSTNIIQLWKLLLFCGKGLLSPDCSIPEWTVCPWMFLKSNMWWDLSCLPFFEVQWVVSAALYSSLSLPVPLHLSLHSSSFMKADCCFPLRGCFIYICYPPPALRVPPSLLCFTPSCQPPSRCLLGSADSSTGRPPSTILHPQLLCVTPLSFWLQEHLRDTWDICLCT